MLYIISEWRCKKWLYLQQNYGNLNFPTFFDICWNKIYRALWIFPQKEKKCGKIQIPQIVYWVSPFLTILRFKKEKLTLVYMRNRSLKYPPKWHAFRHYWDQYWFLSIWLPLHKHIFWTADYYTFTF